MERTEEILHTKKYYLDSIFEKLENLTISGRLVWDLKGLDSPFIYRTALDNFYGPIYVNYYETSVTLGGVTYSKLNAPGSESRLISLIDTIRKSIDQDLKHIIDFEKRLNEFIKENESNT